MKKIVNNIGFRVLLLILSLYCSAIFLSTFYSEQEDNTSDTNNDPYLEVKNQHKPKQLKNSREGRRVTRMFWGPFLVDRMMGG